MQENISFLEENTIDMKKVLGDEVMKIISIDNMYVKVSKPLS